jgi:copper(I)-binding protein
MRLCAGRKRAYKGVMQLFWRCGLWLLVFGLLSPFVAQANDNPLVVHDLMVDSVAKGGTVAVRGVLENQSAQELEITGVISSIADIGLFVYVRDPKTDMVFQQPREVLNIGPGAQVVLLPGVLELRLANLKVELTAGMEIPLQIYFKDGSFRHVRVRVSALATQQDLSPTTGGEILIQPVRTSATTRPAWLTR